MQNARITVERITRDNYHMFDDMVSWRMSGVELTQVEKDANKSRDFTDVYDDLEHRGFYTYGALCDGRFVGWISVMYIPKLARRRWNKGVIYIDELWTAPELRGKGVAKRLVKKAFDVQAETGAVEVRVYVGVDNLVARKLYESCGMKPADTALWMRSAGA